MALTKVSLRIPENAESERLDQALASRLSSAPEVARLGLTLSKGKIRKLIIAGAVYLNGGRVRIASKMCRPGARLEVYLDPKKLETGAERSAPEAWTLTPDQILFEDEYIIGVNKPSGLPTQPTLDEARANLYVLLQKFLRARDGKEVYVGLHHRLDRDTSGAMIFTKAKAANAEIGRAFQEHLAQKTYLALVTTTNPLPDSGQIDNYLAREPGKAGKMRAVRSGGDRAITDYRVRAAIPGYALVEAKPRTGRMHQIRVHLSGLGAPIVGDRTYGGVEKIRGDRTVSRVMLHAASLTFPHPITKLEITLTAPLNPDFQQCLSHLFGSELRS